MHDATLTHLTEDGAPRMVDVSAKEMTRRMARASCRIKVGPRIAALLRERGAIDKGNVLDTGRLAGIMAAKRTAELIPLCHPLPLDGVELTAVLEDDAVAVTSEVRCQGKTGAEMEALVAASMCSLTIYDMCKSADKGITIESLRLVEKRGGKSGHWRSPAP